MKRVFLSLIMIMLTLTGTFPVSAEASEVITIYVSPRGNDSSTGEYGAPLATLNGAKNKVRKIKEDSPNNKIQVFFEEGTYLFDDTVNFAKEDSGTKESPVVYAAHNNAKVIFTGGEKISGTKFSETDDERVSQSVKSKVYEYDLGAFMISKGYSLEDYYPLYEDYYPYSYIGKRPIYSFDNESALYIARYPNKVGGYHEKENPHTWFMKTAVTTDDAVRDSDNNITSTMVNKTSFYVIPNVIDKYAGYTDVWVQGYPQNVFYHSDFKIENITSTETGTTFESVAIIDSQLSKDVSKTDKDFFIYNILEELDAPGEYYIDKDTGMFYVFYENDITKTNLNVSLLQEDYMVKTNGTSFITFSGITFENTKGSGIKVLGGEEVNIRFCEFNNMGVSAIDIGEHMDGTPYTDMGQASEGGYTSAIAPDFETGDSYATRQHKFWRQEKFSVENTGKNHSIYSCEIQNTGYSSINVYGGSVHRDELAGHKIENCKITYPGVYKRTYAGAIKLNDVHGIDIRNNTLAHLPATAINGSTTVANIEYNDIYDGMTESYDNGLIYLNYCYPALDVKITNNYLHDVVPENSFYLVGGAPSTSHPSQRLGIYFDNNYGGGVTIKNNYFVNIPKASDVKTNCEVSKNVFINCGKPTEGTFKEMREEPEGSDSWEPSYYYPFESGKTMEDMDYINTSRLEYYKALTGLPIFADVENKQNVTDTWNEKYPLFMNWVDIINSQEHTGRKFFRLEDNLVVNTGTDPVVDEDIYLIEYGHPDSQGPTADRLDYPDNIDTTFTTPMNNYANNNVYMNDNPSTVEGCTNYTVDTGIFEDFENGNYQLTTDYATQNDFSTLMLRDTGAKETQKDSYIDEQRTVNKQYLPTKVVYITGVAPKRMIDNYATLMVIDENNKPVYADEKLINNDRSYSFKFTTDLDISKCKVYVRSGMVSFKENILVTSNVKDVMTPKLSIDKEQIKLTMTLSNNFDITDYKYNLIFALYDDNGKLIGVNQTGEKTAVDGENPNEVSIVIEDKTDIKTMKGFIWDKNLKPLGDMEFINYQ